MWHYLSCRKFTVAVRTDDRGVIQECAPIVKVFKGQPLNNLQQWVAKLDRQYQHVVMPNEQEK